MIKLLVTLNLETPKEILEELDEVICSAFKNSYGNIENSHKVSPYHFLFEGTEKDLNCLFLGLEKLSKNETVMKYVKAINFDKNEDDDIYKVIIRLKDNISDILLDDLTRIINAAFDNRGGKLERRVSDSPYDFVFIAENVLEHSCLDLGVVLLSDRKIFLNNISIWKWVEYNDFECVNLIDLYSKYM